MIFSLELILTRFSIGGEFLRPWSEPFNLHFGLEQGNQTQNTRNVLGSAQEHSTLVIYTLPSVLEITGKFPFPGS